MPRNPGAPNAFFKVVLFLPAVAFLLLWQWIGSIPRFGFFFSTPIHVVQALLALARRGELFIDTGITAWEAIAGFLLGNLIGAMVGIGLSSSRILGRIASPYLTICGAVPVFALAPMTILWFGIGMLAKIALAFLGTVFIAAAQAHRGANEVDPLLRRRFLIFGANRAAFFKHLLLPAVSTWIIASLRLTIGSALLGAFVGEFIASERGLGHLILRASSLYDSADVLAGIFTLAMLALCLDALVIALEKRLFRWRA